MYFDFSVSFMQKAIYHIHFATHLAFFTYLRGLSMSVNQCTLFKKPKLLHSVPCHEFAILYVIITFDGRLVSYEIKKPGIPVFSHLCKNINGISSQKWDFQIALHKERMKLPVFQQPYQQCY